MCLRNIVQIDEEKCNGCGLCVPSCEEGAIQIVEGKARLIGDVYCDGLGACLGECPEGAITIVQREAVEFDEEMAKQHVERLKNTVPEGGCACPGVAVEHLQFNLKIPEKSDSTDSSTTNEGESIPSELGQWPIQLHLVPADAPFLKNADLLLVADCVPFSMAGFHDRFLRGHPIVIGCPKLDDTTVYVEKLAAMMTLSKIESLTVLHMEVPCCTGLVRVAEAAKRISGRDVPIEDVTISIRGNVVSPGFRQ